MSKLEKVEIVRKMDESGKKCVESISNNLKMGVSKGKLTITVDLEHFCNQIIETAYPESESGKSYILATAQTKLKSKGLESVHASLNLYVTKKDVEAMRAKSVVSQTIPAKAEATQASPAPSAPAVTPELIAMITKSVMEALTAQK